jgi:hypothetical protein
VGRDRLDDAFRSLSTLAEEGDVELQVAVADALGDLLQDEPGTFTAPVLSEILRWAQTRRNRLDRGGRFVFLLLARWQQTEGEEGDRTVAWPTLLDAGRYQPEAYDTLVELWRLSLNVSGLNRSARFVLGLWAAQVERTGSPWATDALLGLVTALAADPRTAAILRRTAREWRDGDGTPNGTDGGPAPLLGARAMEILGDDHGH